MMKLGNYELWAEEDINPAFPSDSKRITVILSGYADPYELAVKAVEIAKMRNPRVEETRLKVVGRENGDGMQVAIFDFYFGKIEL